VDWNAVAETALFLPISFAEARKPGHNANIYYDSPKSMAAYRDASRFTLSARLIAAH
jgi:hypothetical protein